jgi:hypothetical protein
MNVAFANLPTNNAKNITVEGKASSWDNGSATISVGQSVIKGLGSEREKRPAVGRISIQFDEEKLNAIRKDKLQDSATVQQDSIVISIAQHIGEYVVYRSLVKYWIIWNCARPFSLDKIRLVNNVSNDRAAFLVDARRSGGCVNDVVFRGSGIISVGNFIERGSCPSEVSVFSDDNALAFIQNVTVWTTPPTDVLTVELNPMIVAPVSVWTRLNPNTSAGDLQSANLMYNTNHAGIGFNATSTNLVGNNNAAAVIPNDFSCTGAQIAALQASAFYNANQLNVYYVNRAFTGFNCIADPNIIFVGTIANNQTLAHEFGHAFSLDHTNGLAGFSAFNLMIGGGTNRNNITEGQDFRMNLNPTSVLNTNGVRTGPTRACPDGTTSQPCPALSLDVTPNN